LVELTPFSSFNSTFSILGQEKNAFLPAQELKLENDVDRVLETQDD